LYFKKVNFFLIFFFKLIFLNCFDILISKLKKNIISIYFQVNFILKNNYYYNTEQPSNFLIKWCWWPWSIVLRPGPARRVDPGPGRPGPGTGPGEGKNPLGNWPGETRSTRRVDPGPGPPGQTRVRPGLFFF